MDIIAALEKQSCFCGHSAVSSKEITKAEAELSLKFSKDYREYIGTFGFAIYEGHELTGICKAKRLNVVDVTKDERMANPNIPDNWYVIEQLHIDGIVIWQSSTGEVFESYPNGSSRKIGNSLADYIER